MKKMQASVWVSGVDREDNDGGGPFGSSDAASNPSGRTKEGEEYWPEFGTFRNIPAKLYHSGFVFVYILLKGMAAITSLRLRRLYGHS
jgi:hypothetical protein